MRNQKLSSYKGEQMLYKILYT